MGYLGEDSKHDTNAIGIVVNGLVHALPCLLPNGRNDRRVRFERIGKLGNGGAYVFDIPEKRTLDQLPSSVTGPLPCVFCEVVLESDVNEFSGVYIKALPSLLLPSIASIRRFREYREEYLL